MTNSNKKNVMAPLLFSVIAIAMITMTATTAVYAVPILKIKHPTSNALLHAHKAIIISGTSAPSNATRTKCTVQIALDGQGFNQTTALGKAGAFTVWQKTLTPQEPGKHTVEAQLVCAAPGTNKINYVKHTTLNFTATSGPLPAKPLKPGEVAKAGKAEIGGTMPGTTTSTTTSATKAPAAAAKPPGVP